MYQEQQTYSDTIGENLSDFYFLIYALFTCVSQELLSTVVKHRANFHAILYRLIPLLCELLMTP